MVGQLLGLASPSTSAAIPPLWCEPRGPHCRVVVGQSLTLGFLTCEMKGGQWIPAQIPASDPPAARAGAVNSFYEGPGNKQFSLSRPNGLCSSYLTLSLK